MSEVAQQQRQPAPRIGPGGPSDVGRFNHALTWVLGLAIGGGRPNVFATLARHRRLFRAWLRFAGRLMPGGSLPRDEAELVILRVAHNCASDYEWRHHVRLGRAAGLTEAEIERVREGADAEGWGDQRAALLRAADELHEARTISDQLWAKLSARLSAVELIELCMLVGNYEMLAMTLNALGVQPDAPAGEPPRLARHLQVASARVEKLRRRRR